MAASTSTCDLVDWFRAIDDPRHPRWVEHPLPVVLALCAGAVVAGMRSFNAIAGCAADVPTEVLARLYARCGTRSQAWGPQHRAASAQAAALVTEPRSTGIRATDG